ncbi:MAG: YfcE family phosphodiesterase, partial [Oscillospiraceae bacterium]|nr:YfcE family phosphodiesterase [Oscillospiraceae bacterium]
ANPQAYLFIHLGDGERHVAFIRHKHPDINLISVRGNCDWGMESPDYAIAECGDIKIFCTHGHRYYVKDGTETLRSVARDNGCKAALFGHTHERYIACEDGIDVMNPGSCRLPRDGMKPSYGFIDVTDAGVFMNIIDVGV